MHARPLIMGSFRTACASCCLNRLGGNYRKVAESPGWRIKEKARYSHCDWEPLLLFYDGRRSLGQLLHTPIAREDCET